MSGKLDEILAKVNTVLAEHNAQLVVASRLIPPEVAHWQGPEARSHAGKLRL